MVETLTPLKCSHCQADLASPIVCAGCRAIFPPSYSTDYFALIGLERKYEIDQSELAAAFRAIARQIHPDRFADQGEQAMHLAANLAAMVNEAFGVLKDPVLRADYLLELAGGPSAIAVRDVPGNLLADVLMIREEIEDARSANDAATLERIRADVVERRKAAVGSIAKQAGDLTRADESVRKEFRKLLNSMRYYDNLLAELTVDPFAKSEPRALARDLRSDVNVAVGESSAGGRRSAG